MVRPSLRRVTRPGVQKHPDVLVHRRQREAPGGKKPADRVRLETEHVNHLAPVSVGEGAEQAVEVIPPSPLLTTVHQLVNLMTSRGRTSTLES